MFSPLFKATCKEKILSWETLHIEEDKHGAVSEDGSQIINLVEDVCQLIM